MPKLQAEYVRCYRDTEKEIRKLVWEQGVQFTVETMREVLVRMRRRKGARSPGEQGSYLAVMRFCNRWDPLFDFNLDYPEEGP